MMALLLAGCGKEKATQNLKPTSKADSMETSEPRPEDDWTQSMAWIPGGSFQRGSENGQGDDKPSAPLPSGDFGWTERRTNRQYHDFVRATGYVAVAERQPDPRQFPGADPSLLVAGAIALLPTRRVSLRDHYAWWRYVPK